MKIAILLSVFNGELYLGKQVKSILEQKDVKLDLFIRDDGSTDGSRELVESIAATDPRVHLIIGHNVGYKRSFLELVNEPSMSDYDYFAFADQDDLWKMNKLAVLQERIVTLEEKNTHLPIMVYSNGKVFSNQGEGRRLYQRPRIISSFIDASFRPLYGMSFLINLPLRNILVETEASNFDLWGHDGWTAIVASAVGKVDFVDRDLVLYRQHGDNASGLKNDYTKFSLGFLLATMKTIKQREHSWEYKLSSLSEELHVSLSDKVNAQSASLIQRLTSSNENRSARMKLFLSSDFTAHSKVQDLVFRVLLFKWKI